MKIGKLTALAALAATAMGVLPQPSQASFPGRNGHIAWIWDNRVYRDAGDHRRVSLTGFNFYARAQTRSLAYSPDGRRIAVVGSRRDKPLEVWIMRSDGSKLHQVTDRARGSAIAVGFSPDGKRLVASYAPGPGQDPDLFIVRTDGSKMRRITTGNAADLAPQWSPNGRYILYRRDPGRRPPQWWTVRPDGSSNRLFARLGTGALDFTPSGRSVLYLAERSDSVFRMSVATGQRELLRRGDRSDSLVAPLLVAPNGGGFAVQDSGEYTPARMLRFDLSGHRAGRGPTLQSLTLQSLGKHVLAPERPRDSRGG